MTTTKQMKAVHEKHKKNVILMEAYNKDYNALNLRLLECEKTLEKPNMISGSIREMEIKLNRLKIQRKGIELFQKKLDKLSEKTFEKAYGYQKKVLHLLYHQTQ